MTRSAALTLRTNNEVRMLRPLGGPVEIRACRPCPGQRLPALAGDHRSYSTLAALMASAPKAGEILGRLGAPREPEDLQEHFEDAARRISPSNSRSLDALEHAVEVVRDCLEQFDDNVLILPSADRIDAPSLRLIGVAWARRTPRPGGRLVLELHSVLPGAAATALDTAYDIARRATLGGVVAVLQAKRVGPMIAASGYRGTPLDFATALTAFWQRNYELAAAGPAETPDELLLQALVAARLGRRRLALARLDEMESRARRPVDRARACSTRAVVQAKLGGREALADAMAAVHRGLDHLGDDRGAEASGQRGWLFNNGGFVEIMSHSDARGLHRGSVWLSRAMGEVARLGADWFPGLHYNVRANAVQLFEMQGRFPEALDWLERTFTGTEHPSYHYRCAALALKAGRPAKALEALDRAESLCTPREWPFLEHIERARGAVLFQIVRIAEAEECFRRGLSLCWRARAATGFRHHAASLLACLRKQGNDGEADGLLERLVAEEGASLPPPDVTGEPPRPPGKLPPHIPEVDLYWPGVSDINQTEEIRS